ncbi:MAG: DNA glycosylase AlkZ-like family protein, partial [Actinomycetota bacterium]
MRSRGVSTAQPATQRVVGLSADEARRAALWAQGLLGTRATPKSEAKREQAVVDMLEHLGAVQLDTISVLARSHELVAYARLGAIGRRAVEAAYWNSDAAFEYWSHAACILPMSEWPWFAFRRRHYARRG